MYEPFLINQTLVCFYLQLENNLDSFINKLFDPLVELLSFLIFFKPFGFLSPENSLSNIPFVLIWLITGAIFFTFKFRFINIKGFKHAINLIRGRYEDPKNKGQVTHFQALVTAISGTVGLGNIAGVAMAISIGGPGATLWMILAGFLGMSAKFAECTLGTKYREVSPDGKVYGGPMSYLSKGMKLKGKWQGKLGKLLAILFSILCIGGSFGGGNMFQANQSFSQLSTKLPLIETISFLGLSGSALFGIILALLVGITIIGGIKSMVKITDKIVPLMIGLYVIAALVIIIINISHLPEAFTSIFQGAFAPHSIKGGVIGVLVVGFQRAAFSNEAGIGSASIAHAAAKTDEPISEGIVALIEPFIDTILICTMTSLVIIFTGYADNNPDNLQGAQLTAAAFSSVFSWFDWLLIVSILLFAFSTMISWSYYGIKAWSYLFGKSKLSELIYKTFFLIFIVIGSVSKLGAVIDFSDMMILGMAVPNLIGLYFFANEIQDDLKEYMRKLKNGMIKRTK